jgi:hypothetical protein
MRIILGALIFLSFCPTAFANNDSDGFSSIGNCADLYGASMPGTHAIELADKNLVKVDPSHIIMPVETIPSGPKATKGEVFDQAGACILSVVCPIAIGAGAAGSAVASPFHHAAQNRENSRWEVAKILFGTYEGAVETVELNSFISELQTLNPTIGSDQIVTVLRNNLEVGGKLCSVHKSSDFGGYSLSTLSAKYRVKNPGQLAKFVIKELN